MSLDGCRHSVTSPFDSFRLRKVNAIVASRGSLKYPRIVIASGVITVEKHFLRFWIASQKRFNSMLHNRWHNWTILFTLLKYVHKGLGFICTITISCYVRQMPWHPSLAKPMGLRLPVPPWNVLHGPILCNIVSSLTLSSMSERAMSCFTYRNWWALNAFISCLAVSTVNVISSFTSHEGRGTVSTAFSISVMTSLRILQLPQSSSCVCWQLGTESDPNECWKQWSATLNVSSTWTCKEKSEERD